MPVLTQDEFDDLNQRLVNAEDGLKDLSYDLEEANEKTNKEKNQKTIFLVMSVVFFLLLVAITSVYR
jgi:predicted  nucleic acid-binding Zn-ribbon protein